MMKKNLSILALALFAAAPVLAFASEGAPHWSYTGHEGPEHWGELAPEYHVCAEGKNQSPINIAGTIDADLAPIGIRYGIDASEILNNGHTVQANFPPGNSIQVDGIDFELKQVHFHAPSENQVLGVSYAMEAHFVHADANGNLAVIAVMMSEGAESPGLAKLWAQMPASAGERVALTAQLNPAELLPQDRDYYRFNGSLTTPPCSEGVRWLVMKNSVTVSTAQISAFSGLLQHPNNRPVQRVNARPVLR